MSSCRPARSVFPVAPSMWRAVLAVFFAAGLSVPAHAERLITALSTDLVSISSNFTGSQIVFFGAIERDAQTVARPSDYQIIIEVKGPPTNVVTRQKERTFGVWINRDSERYRLVPAFYAVLASAPLDRITPEAALARMGIGMDMVPLRRAAEPVRPFRSVYEKAFLRLMQDQGRYMQDTGAVKFLTPSLFQATLPMPANVPVGTYEAKVMLFQDNTKLAEETYPIEVAKIGFEQFMAKYSRDHGFLYGIATVLMAGATGWLAGIIFRRD